MANSGDHDAMTPGEPDHDVVAGEPENIWRPWECDDYWADEALGSYSCFHRELVSDKLREHRPTIKELRERDPERYEELRAFSDAEGEGDDWLDEIAMQAAGPDCICIVGEGMGAEVGLTAEASARIDHAVADVLWCLRDQRPADSAFTRTVTTSMRARTRPRRRGAGRPRCTRRRTTRNSARSGDSGDSDGEGEPAGRHGAQGGRDHQDVAHDVAGEVAAGEVVNVSAEAVNETNRLLRELVAQGARQAQPDYVIRWLTVALLVLAILQAVLMWEGTGTAPAPPNRATPVTQIVTACGEQRNEKCRHCHRLGLAAG